MIKCILKFLMCSLSVSVLFLKKIQIYCIYRFWVYLNLFDLSDVVNITFIVHYGIELNILIIV